MRVQQYTVESFPLTIGKVTNKYRKLPDAASDVFYHYTTKRGLEGILRSNGLRATYRKRMNDKGEFSYAWRKLIRTLNQTHTRTDLPTIAQRLTTYILMNLKNLPNESIDVSSAYCACLSISPDHPGQWDNYGEGGKGFTIGFNLRQIINSHIILVSKGKPFIYCAPVIYDERDQHNLVVRLVEAGINDLQTFAKTCSKQSDSLTALRDRVTQEIIVELYSIVNFIKAPKYRSEREVRIFLDSNDGTLNASKIQHYEHNKEYIPFVFIDLCNPITKRLPLTEIRVGPKASFTEKERFLNNLLDELGYGSNYTDKPRIVYSR